MTHTLANPESVVAALGEAERAALTRDEAEARAVVGMLLEAARRAQNTHEEWARAHGEIPLAAAPTRRFPLVWVAPALALGKVFGSDVTAWVIGFEARFFLRLVNVPPRGPDEMPPLELDGGRAVQPEFRVRPELPFALDELAEDCVYELLPQPEEGAILRVRGGPTWTLPTAGYAAETERPGLRESWGELMSAYALGNAANPTARRAALRGALDRLLFVRTDRTQPRCLRPWALLTLQALSAEVLRAAPRRAREFGLGALAEHPQCFESLVRRLPKDGDGR